MDERKLWKEGEHSILRTPRQRRRTARRIGKVANSVLACVLSASMVVSLSPALTALAAEAASASAEVMQADVASDETSAEEVAAPAEEATEEAAEQEPADTQAEADADAADEAADQADADADTDATEADDAQQADDASDADATDADDAQTDDATGADDAADSAADDAQQPEEAADYPAANLDGSANGVTVSVSAPKGALPEGAKMKVADYSEDSAKAAVGNAVAGEVTAVKAVDISFVDKDGNTTKPKEQVAVSLESSIISEAVSDSNSELSLVHIGGSGAALVSATTSGSKVTFSSKDFSPYVLVRSAKAPAADAGSEDAGEDEPQAKTWKVTFYNRDAEAIKTIEVEDGNAIGTLPDTIAREDYVAHWAIGEIVDGGQGNTIEVTGGRISSSYKPEADMTIVPDYDQVTRTVTFLSEDKADTVATKTVTADTSYCLNDIPTVPAKDGYIGKWVYSGGDFNNAVAITEDTTVWAEYTQNVFTVTFMVDKDTYYTDKKYANDALTLPTNPVLPGQQFVGWFVDDTQYNGGEQVTSDLTLQAKFVADNSVSFVVVDDKGAVSERLSQYYRSEGEAIGVMPQDPFVAGKVFEKWVVASEQEDGTLKPTETVVTADTVVTESMTVMAVFREVAVYNITAEYYYLNDSGEEVVFNSELLQAEEQDLPYTITAPASTQTDPNQVKGAPVYYPQTPTVTIEKSDFSSDKKYTARFQYVKYTAVYDFVYLLKNLDGNGYSEIDRTKDVQGVLNSYVTPTVKSYDYATLEKAEGAVVETTGMDGQAKQELKVYYNRKDFQLSYDTNGGSYVAGGTYAYGSTVNLSTQTPTRTGYTFDGWYSDQELTNKVLTNVTINSDTTLYAKWKGNKVNYTVVYMKEVYNANGDNTWAYENSKKATAVVGTEINASGDKGLSSAPNGYERDTSRNGSEAEAAENGTKVTIAADGSTVLKVYYKLIRYTLVFNINRTTGRITIGGQTYKGSEYKIENVVLGQDISAFWPSSSNEIYDTATGSQKQRFQHWAGAAVGNYLTKRYVLIWDDVAKANKDHVMTFTAKWTSDSNNSNAEYWLQQADGTWKKEDAYTQTGLNTNNLSAKNIDGYTIRKGTPAGYEGSGESTSSTTVHHDAFDDEYNDQGLHFDSRPDGWVNSKQISRNGHIYTYNRSEKVQVGYGWYTVTRYNYIYTCHEDAYDETVSAGTYTYRFYYDRAQYNIYYNYNGKQIDQRQNIYYEADISGSTYNFEPPRPAGVDSDYTWGGWYADSSLAEPAYTFTTMPGNDLPLYAKWVAPSYTVKFVDTDGTTELADSKTVEKRKTVSAPENTPVKAGYTFEGWYTTADGATLYDWNNQITADTTVYAHWSKNTLGYTVHYVDESGNTVAPDKVVTNRDYVVDQTVTEQAIAVAGYRPDESSKTLTLKDDTSANAITFVYSQKADSTSYTVKYVLDPNEFEGEIEVAESKTVEDVPGETTSLVETAAAVNYDLLKANPDLAGLEFYPDAVEKTIVLTADADKNVLTFYYSSYKSFKFTVNYVDMAGEEIAETHVETLKVGNTFTPSRTAINGWELAKAVVGTEYDDAEAAESYKVNDTTGDMTFTLFYKKKLTITAKSATKQYDGTALVLPEDLAGKVTVDGLLDGDTLNTVDFAYADADNVEQNGRVNAGVATVTPGNAWLTNDSKHFATEGYYSIRYISGRLDVTKINVTIRVEPDRWTGNVYDGTEKKTGFTNGSKGITDYVMISSDQYANATTDDGTTYLNYIWGKITARAIERGAAGLGYVMVSKKDVGDYEYTVSLTQADLPVNDNYSVSIYVRPGRLQILPAEVTVKANDVAKTYDGKAATANDATVTGLIGSDTVDYSVGFGVEDVINVQTSEGAVVANGAAEQGNYTVSYENGNLTISPKEVTIKTESASKEYDGTALTAGGSIDGLVEGESATVTATGTQTEVGDSSNTYTIDWGTTNKNNYTVTEDLGTLTVNKSTANITLAAASDSKTYDGKALINDKVAATGLPEGFTVEAKASGSQTDVGSSANVVNDGYVIKNAAGKDKTDNFTNVKKVDGTLTVNAASLTITTGSASKAYDGTALTNDEASIEGLVNGETATVTATGTQTEVGDSKNTYSIDWGTAKEGNYTVTENLGTLTITTNPADVVLTAASGSKTYDGKALINDKVAATGLPEGFTVEATASGSQIDAGSSANVVTDGYKFLDKDGKDKTDNFTNVKKVDGTLTVNAAPVTITTGSDSKAYDGTPLTKAEANITGLVNNETATVTATGSQTEVGKTSNTYSIDWGTAKEGNYTVTENLGTLTITENGAEVTLTAASGEKTYDGTALTGGTVTATGLPEGFTVDAKASGSQTDAGSSANVVDDGYVIKNAAGEDKTANFTKVAKVDGTLTVNAAPVTITTGSGSKAYDGTALTNAEASITGLVNGETATVTATGSQTEVGDSKNTYSIDWGTTNKNNYTVTEDLGTLTVNKSTANITLTAASDSKTYDGTALTNGTVTATGLPEGFTVDAKASGSQTDAGSSANVVDDGYKFLDKDGKDKTDNFTNVEKANGTLTVTLKAVTITAKSQEFTYDGQAHTNDGYDVDGLVGDDKISAVVTGSITFPSESPVVNKLESYEFTTGKASNYDVSTVNGQLTMKNAEQAITITAASDAWPYDGAAHTNSGVTVTSGSLLSGDELVATATGSVTNVADTATGNNPIAAGYKIMHGNENVTANYRIATEAGTLTINPIDVTVTITGHNNTAAYDGTEHAVTGYDVQISNQLYKEADFTFSGTAEAKRTDVGTTEMGLAEEQFANTNSNFGTVTFNVTDGYQTITAKDKVVVTITGHNNTADYDGEEHTASGYDVQISDPLYKETDFTFNGTAEAARTDAGTTNMGLAKEQFANTNKNFRDVTFNVTDGYQTINPIDVVVTVTGANNTADYDGKEHSVTGYTATASTELYDVDEDFTFSGTAKAARTDAGTTKMGLTADQFTNTNGNFKDVTFNVTDGYQTIDPIDVVVTVTGANNTADYDGKEHSVTGYTATASTELYDVDEDFTFSGIAEAKRTDVGTTDMGLAAGQFANTNKNFKDVTFEVTDGYQKVTPADLTVTIKGNEGSTEYNGSEQFVTGYTVSIPEGAKLAESDIKGPGQSSAVAEGTDVGTYNMGLKVEDFSASNGNYNVTFEVTDGKLEITKADLTVEITGNSSAVTYNGSEQSVTGYTVSIPEGATLTEAEISGPARGEAVAKGTNAGEYPMDLEDTDFSTNNGNYNVTFAVTDGKLIITQVDEAVVTITGHNATVAYDGAEHAVDGYDVTISNELYTADDFTFDGTATAARTDAGTTDMGLAEDMFSNKNDNFAKVTFEVTDGFVTITPASASANPVTVDSYAGEYDGAAHALAASAAVEGSTLQYSTDNQTWSDEPPAFTNVTDGAVTVYVRAQAPNYEDSFGQGTVSITPRNITLTSGTSVKTYDGTPLTNSEVTASYRNATVAPQFLSMFFAMAAEGDTPAFASTDEGHISYDVTGTQTEVGTSDNTFTYAFDDATVGANYNVQAVYGTLTVEEATPTAPAGDGGDDAVITEDDTPQSASDGDTDGDGDTEITDDETAKAAATDDEDGDEETVVEDADDADDDDDSDGTVTKKQPAGTTIEDDETPLGAAVRTGDDAAAAATGTGLLAAIGGFLALFGWRRRREEEQGE